MRVDEDTFINGNLTSTSMTIPSGTVGDAAVAAAADIAHTKLEHQHRHNYAQASGSTSATETRVIATIRGTTGVIQNFRAGSVTVCAGAATITFQLQKNGSNILATAITLDSSSVARGLTAAGGFTSTALAADDVLEVVITATASGGTIGNGAFCELTWSEKAQ